MAAMNELSEHFLEIAERHVREGEQRVLRQQELIAELELAGRHDTVRMARELLATLTDLLKLSRDHLALERKRLAMEQIEFSPRPASPPPPASE